MRFLNPQNFNTRSFSSGDYIKVGLYVSSAEKTAERFWIKVLSKGNDSVYGIVDNQLLFEKEHGYNFGHFISVPNRFILDVLIND